MKIGIAGNYGNDNQGDESVLEGVIVQLEDTFDVARENIIVFSNNPEQTKQRYGTDATYLYIDKGPDPVKFGLTLLRNRKTVASLDLMVIGGGGILMDLYRSNPFVFGIYGLLIKWAKVPAAVFGVGVGPINTFLGKQFIKMIGNAVDVITVRDHGSKELIKKIGVKTPTHTVMDPAFYLKYKGEKQANTKPLHIGVTALPYYNGTYWPTDDSETYGNFIQGMASNLDLILEGEPEAKIEFFSTKHPYDTNTTKDIQALMKHQDRTRVWDEMLTHQEIMTIAARQDVVIGTRLHSLILSIVAKTPVIAVGYHNKVLDVMQAIGNQANTLKISQVSEDRTCMLSIYQAMKQDWQGTLDQFDDLAERIIEEAPDGMKIVQSMLNQVKRT